MAIIKLGGLITAMSGKIGGQSISNRVKETTVRNIVHTNKSATVKQSIQRFKTAAISNSYGQLNATQRNNWVKTSENYFYINGVGDTIQRSGYSTFLFCNQNRILINQSLRVSPAKFVAIGSLDVDIVYIEPKVLVIQGLLAVTTNSYVLFAHSTTMSVANPNAVNLLNCGLLSYSDLQNGVDIAPIIESATGIDITGALVTFQVVPIHTTSGNRFLTQPRQQVALV